MRVLKVFKVQFCTVSGVFVGGVPEGGWSLVVEGFVSEEEYFELNPLWDREPMEFLEIGDDVVMGAGVGEQASSRILNMLEFIKEFEVS